MISATLKIWSKTKLTLKLKKSWINQRHHLAALPRFQTIPYVQPRFVESKFDDLFCTIFTHIWAKIFIISQWYLQPISLKVTSSIIFIFIYLYTLPEIFLIYLKTSYDGTPVLLKGFLKQYPILRNRLLFSKITTKPTTIRH